jgi:hypothetical protein
VRIRQARHFIEARTANNCQAYFFIHAQPPA